MQFSITRVVASPRPMNETVLAQMAMRIRPIE